MGGWNIRTSNYEAVWTNQTISDNHWMWDISGRVMVNTDNTGIHVSNHWVWLDPGSSNILIHHNVTYTYPVFDTTQRACHACTQGGICRGTGGLTPNNRGKINFSSLFRQFVLNFYIYPLLLFTTNYNKKQDCLSRVVMAKRHR